MNSEKLYSTQCIELAVISNIILLFHGSINTCISDKITLFTLLTKPSFTMGFQLYRAVSHNRF